MLGGYSALALRKAGHEIVACGRRQSDNGFFQSIGCCYIGGITLEDAKAFDKLPLDIDAVVHMAGAMPAHADASPMQYVQSIVVGIVNVLEWMKVRTQARRIIFNTTPSDVCAFFGNPTPVPNDAPRSFPKDGGDHAVYAICKNAAVDILNHYEIAVGFTPIVFRHLTVYGWHPNAEYYVNGVKRILPWRQIVRKCIAGEPIEVWGDANRKKELLYIDDFTDAVRRALDTDICGIFNLPGDRPYTLLEQIEGIAESFSPAGRKVKMIFCPQKQSTPENVLSGEKTQKVLGWAAKRNWQEACHLMRAACEQNCFEKLWGSVSQDDMV